MPRLNEEVGDLFVTESRLMLKLLPSNKSGSATIRWFADGSVTDQRRAARDIAALVSRLKGKTRVVRGLTLMTSQGLRFDLRKSGLARAVQDAGYRLLP